jgi:hypothetical protein
MALRSQRGWTTSTRFWLGDGGVGFRAGGLAGRAGLERGMGLFAG